MTTYDQHPEDIHTLQQTDPDDARTDRANWTGTPEDPSTPPRHEEAAPHPAPDSAVEYDDGRHVEVTDSERPRPESSVSDSSTAPSAPAAPRTAGESPDGPQTGTESSLEASLFADDELTGLRARWDHVQAGFVDDPKDCVQRADSLVSDVVSQLTSGFTDARSRLEQQWGRGEEASTEDLRIALKRYREFFERLLAV